MRAYSIILPVRNGSNYVKECVNSILSQTYTNFNLIILDNCSTDGTLEWISSLSDERVIIYPSQVSLTIEENWARITTVPRNEFMTCIGHDDTLLPGYLAEMDKLITSYPEVALYQSHFTYINANGEPIRNCKPMEEKISAALFLEKMLTSSIDLNGTGFMLRTKDYDAIGGIPNYPNLLFADFALWLKVGLKNGLAVSPVNCFNYRLHQSMTTSSTDEKFQLAFAEYVQYLYSLKKTGTFNAVINKDAPALIGFYCKSFAHRLLRTPLEKRKGLTVKSWTKKCRHFANLLIDSNTYDPSAAFSVKVAEFIDSNALGRKAFLLFKKVYSKPVL